jgi:hypothetical protein
MTFFPLSERQSSTYLSAVLVYGSMDHLLHESEVSER